MIWLTALVYLAALYASTTLLLFGLAHALYPQPPTRSSGTKKPLKIRTVLDIFPHIPSSQASRVKLASTLEYYARTLVGVFCFFLSAFYGTCASLYNRAIGEQGLSQWTTARCFKYTMGYLAGVWFDIVEGEEHLSTRPMVLIGNHQTELDVLMLGAVFPKYTSVTAKSSLKWVPILGWFSESYFSRLCVCVHKELTVRSDAFADSLYQSREPQGCYCGVCGGGGDDA